MGRLWWKCVDLGRGQRTKEMEERYWADGSWWMWLMECCRMDRVGGQETAHNSTMGRRTENVHGGRSLG